MKKLCVILVLFALVACQGCASNLLDQIPHVEFERFRYHRGGNITSATIDASNSSIKDGVLKIESIEITEDWGPAFSLNITLEEYQRKLQGATNDN